jgi:hypothetical protein
LKVIFLHIPKTAGQSVHAALVNAFGKESVCPARVNDQLRRMSITELNRYQVFSGHFDWSLLDCIKGPKYVFTILREPIDRILSFYFYLRDEAEKLPLDQRETPERQGLKAAFGLSPRDYFLGGAPHLRRFLDDHYDNFYTYYFAGRHYESRGEMVGLINRNELSHQHVLQMAKDNLTLLDDVFTVDNMGAVISAIREISGKQLMADDKYRTNVNTKVPAADRKMQIQALGADTATMERLHEFCSLDNELWKLFAMKSVPSTLQTDIGKKL